MNALKSIQNKMANSGDYLGDEVFWSISDADIEPQVVRSLCVQHGLDVRLAPEYPTTEMAFRRAVDRLKARYVQRLAGIADNVIMRKIKEDNEAIVYGVVIEQIEEQIPQGIATVNGMLIDKTVKHKTDDRIAFFKESGDVVSDKNSIAAQEVGNLFEYYKNHLINDDILAMLQKAMNLFQAVAIRERGGVYFVPAHYSEQLKALQTVVESIGKSSVGILNLYGTKTSTSALNKAVNAELTSQLNALVGELKDFNTDTRKSALNSRLEKFKELKQRVKLYDEILTITKDELIAQAEMAERKVIELING